MGFVFDGITSRSMGIKSYLRNWELMPALENNFLKLTWRDGSLDLGSHLGMRTIRLEAGFLPQSSVSGMKEKIDALTAWLSPSEGAKKLVLDEFPDRYFVARISENLMLSRVLRLMGSFELAFVAADPFAYAREDETEVYTAPGSYNFKRLKGNTSSFPKILVKADFTETYRPKLHITINGDTISLSGITPTGSMLEIDCGMQTVRLLNAEGELIGNGMPMLEEPVFPELQMGENTISITAERLSAFEISINACSRWR